MFENFDRKHTENQDKSLFDTRENFFIKCRRKKIEKQKKIVSMFHIKNVWTAEWEDEEVNFVDT